MPASPAHIKTDSAIKRNKCIWFSDLFRQWYKQNEDDDSLTSNEDGHDVGNEEQVDIKEEYVSNPCYSHHHYQCESHLYPVPACEVEEEKEKMEEKEIKEVKMKEG